MPNVLCLLFSEHLAPQHWCPVPPTGSRASALSLEAATQLSSTPSRQCLIVRLKQLTLEVAQDLLGKGPGGLLILMPETLEQITSDQREVSGLFAGGR